MKTIKKQIETIMLILVLVFSINSYAQNGATKNRMFVRVYNLDGKKIDKGYVVSVGDTLLGLKRSGNYLEIDVRGIGKIKTKRSVGHNILIGSAIGATTGVILGSINPPTDSSGGTFTWAGSSSGEEFVAGLTVGVISGTIIGGVSALFKNSTTFTINGDLSKFKIFKDNIEKR